MITKNKFKSRFSTDLHAVCEKLATNDEEMLYLMDEITKDCGDNL